MDSEDISIVSKKERESKEITPLSYTFYNNIKIYLQELENEIIKCNPRSKEALMLSDELNTSIGRIKDIFFLRKNKLFVMVAQASSADMINSPHKNYNRLLPEEKRLYESLTQSGKNLKTELLDPVISSNNEGKKNFIA